MSEMKFATPVFIEEKKHEQIDLAETPYFHNDGGHPRYVKEVPHGAKLIPTAPTDPHVALGNEYVVAQIKGVKKTPPYGIETQLGFVANEVAYAPMWATPDIAAAFGITLVSPGEAVQLESPIHKLSQIEYEYGVFAGHWSPYQDTGNTLLSVVCTDLEHHDFPHIFASIDKDLPLVTSVGRYWPKLHKICLADLWVPRGCALYIPPKPALLGSECIDLHNNRNSARACWGNIHKNTLLTDTLLQATGGFFYWYWNATDTVHTQPLLES
ncbi:MAG: hypothetical protein JNN20_11300 [Betaproteobacteria bacterium]|nr:hypothetical protein [Betaproteobacteria bacterium]